MRRIKVVQLYPGCNFKLGDILYHKEIKNNRIIWTLDLDNPFSISITDEFLNEWPSFFEKLPFGIGYLEVIKEMKLNLDWAQKDLEVLLSSGALNRDEMSVEQMKQIICALLEKRVDCYMPGLHSQAAARRRWRKEINNLRNFI